LVPSFLVIAAATVMIIPGVPVRQTIPPGATCTLGVTTEAGQLVSADIDQYESDLMVTVVAPDGRRLIVRDARERGIEPIAFVSDQAGTYGLEVRAVARSARRLPFSALVSPPRPPVASDDARQEAEELSTEARRLARSGDQASVHQAVALRQKALTLWQAVGRRDLVLALHSAIGDSMYRLSRYDDAYATYLEVLPLSRDLGSKRDEAEILNNLGLAEWRRGHVDDAQRLLNQALTIWNALAFRSGIARTSSNLGIVLRQSGDYDEARQAYLRALSVSRSVGDRQATALALSNMGVVMDALGRPDSAIAFFQQASRLFLAISDRLGRGRALLAQARVEFRRRPGLALTHGRQAVRIISTTTDRIAAADGTLLIARLLDARGQSAEAAIEHDRAFAMYRQIGSPRGEADALHATALSLAASGHADAALDRLERARAIRNRIGLRGPEAETLVDMARLQRQRGALSDAQASLEAALTIIESIQSSVFERELRTSYLAAMLRYFGDYTAVLLARHRLEPDAGFAVRAWQAAERARSRGLVERIRERQLITSVDAPAVLLERSREIERAVNYWSLQLWQEADKTGASAASAAGKKLDALLASRAMVEGDIRRGDPRYRLLMQPEAIDVARIQSALDEETVLVEYMLGDHESYVWTVTAGRIDVTTLDGRREIERRARRFRTLASLNPETPRDPTLAVQRKTERAHLTRLLLNPVASRLDKRRVIVVPDGALHVLPFAALRVPRSRALFGAEHEIILAPSAAVFGLLDEERRSRQSASLMVAAVADPVFNGWDRRVSAPRGVSAASTGRRLSRLPASREEARDVVSLSPRNSVALVDFRASREAVLPLLSHYRYLHFATHAYDDHSRPDLSGIVLSLVDAQGRPQDGFLRLNDISALRLRADLVVLSACETAVGVAEAGDSPVSIARAFFYGGALRVLATLWPVGDDAAAEMMRHLYAAMLTRGETPAAALRTAQQAMRARSRWRDEFYWSGFVLQGLP
jgi:CHAT domain-containing protein/Flp pilus assembly protein TadD